MFKQPFLRNSILTLQVFHLQIFKNAKILRTISDWSAVNKSLLLDPWSAHLRNFRDCCLWPALTWKIFFFEFWNCLPVRVKGQIFYFSFKLSGIGNGGFIVDILVSTQQELSNEPIPNSVGYRKPDLCNSGLSGSFVVDRISQNFDRS